LLGNISGNCGKGGAVCQKCASTESCTNQACIGPDAGTGPAAGTLGAACSSAAECTQVGNLNVAPKPALCKQTTSTGNLTYPNGYCTRRCIQDADCGSTGTCIYYMGPFGEAENICLLKCSGAGTCARKADGYGCYDYNFGDTPADWACWVPQSDGGTPNLFEFEFFDAGTPANQGVMGGPCVNSTQCQPPAQGVCIQEVSDAGTNAGETSGYLGGSCTADCSLGLFTENYCGDGGSCNLYAFNIPNQDPIVAGLCEAKCDPTAAVGTCRTGYTCESRSSSQPTLGKCVPRCNNPGLPQPACAQGETCDGNPDGGLFDDGGTGTGRCL
jgi:hypothetical protein